MADFRQENHNGRVSTTTGSVYNRSHNDREFDISRAENINPDIKDSTKYERKLQYP